VRGPAGGASWSEQRSASQHHQPIGRPLCPLALALFDPITAVRPPIQGVFPGASAVTASPLDRGRPTTVNQYRKCKSSWPLNQMRGGNPSQQRRPRWMPPWNTGIIAVSAERASSGSSPCLRGVARDHVFEDGPASQWRLTVVLGKTGTACSSNALQTREVLRRDDHVATFSQRRAVKAVKPIGIGGSQT
jgi:hypothetical protein